MSVLPRNLPAPPTGVAASMLALPRDGTAAAWAQAANTAVERTAFTKTQAIFDRRSDVN